VAQTEPPRRPALARGRAKRGAAGPIRSFQRSADLSAGVKKYLFSISLLLLALNALGASLLGLGLLITVPLSVLIMTAIYRRLSMADTPRA
jgi:uncharacterized membrane protein